MLAARDTTGDPALWRGLYTGVGRDYHWVDRPAWTDEDITYVSRRSGTRGCGVSARRWRGSPATSSCGATTMAAVSKWRISACCPGSPDKGSALVHADQGGRARTGNAGANSRLAAHLVARSTNPPRSSNYWARGLRIWTTRRGNLRRRRPADVTGVAGWPPGEGFRTAHIMDPPRMDACRSGFRQPNVSRTRPLSNACSDSGRLLQRDSHSAKRQRIRPGSSGTRCGTSAA